MRNMFGVKHRSFGCYGDLYAVFITYVAVLLYLTRGNHGVRISSITVPRSVDNTTAEPAKLDCHFEYDQPSEANMKDRELVVKWMLNSSIVLYQWVYKGPSNVNKTFKDHIDTRNEVPPNVKPTSMPLTLVRKSVDLTGQYTCLVTTFTTEASADADLQVYVPIDEIKLNVTYDNETNYLNVTCNARGVYPKPNLKLTADKNISLELIEMIVEPDDYLFDVTATYWISLDELNTFTTFNCTVSLPAANISQSIAYPYKKSGSEISDNSISSEYTDSTSSSLKDDNAAGSLHRCNCNFLLLVYSLFVISMLRK